MIQIGDFHFTKGQTESVLKILASDRISPTYYVPEFEKAFSQRQACLYGLMTNSGTDALRVMVAAAKEKYGWKDGDKVFVPALTFPATLNVVIQNNLVPVPLDVSMYDYNLNPWQIERRYEPGVKAVLVAHLAGQMAEMDALMEMCQRYDLKLLEDSCEAVGASFDGRPSGSWGEAGAFSFYMAHHITTGVGGMITTNDPEMNRLCRSLINHGRDTRYIPGYTKAPLSKALLKSRYSYDRIGYSCRPTEFEAALGLEQMKLLDLNLEARKKNAKRLLDILLPYRDLEFTGERLSCNHSWMFFLIFIKEESKVDKWDLCLHLEKHGIETRDFFPLLNQPCYKRFGWSLDNFSVAKSTQERGFFIGCHPYLTLEDLLKVEEAFDSFFHKKRKPDLTKELAGVIK